MKKKLGQVKQPKSTAKGKNSGYFVMFVGDDGAILVHYVGKLVVSRLFCPNHSDKSSEALLKIFNDFPKAPIYVLVDLLDQAYVRHTLPPVSSLGVGKIIDRRLNRDFAPSDLKGSISLGREKGGRKDWNFLLISLAYNDKLKGWLELLYELPNRLKGVYLVPIESQASLIKLQSFINKEKNKINTETSAKKPKIAISKTKSKEDVNEKTKWDILVMHNKTGGFRQIVCRDGKMIFTRMAQCAADEKPSIMAGNVEQEVKNTIEYLKRLAFNPQNSELSIIIIIGEDIKANISLDSFNTKNSYCFTPHEAANMLEIGEAVLSGDKFTDILISCHFLNQKKHRLKLMSEPLKKINKLYELINIAKIVFIIGLIGLIGVISFNGYEMFVASQNISDKTLKMNSINNRYIDYKARVENFVVEPEKIDTLIKVHDLIGKPTDDYLEIVKILSGHVSSQKLIKTFDFVNNQNTNATTSTPPAAAPTDATNSSNFELKLEWQLFSKESDNNKLKKTWADLIANLQKDLPTYKVIDEGIVGLDNEKDRLNINFTQKNDANNQAQSQLPLIARMKIVKADPASDPSNQQNINNPNFTAP
jgi:hypothetical protein